MKNLMIKGGISAAAALIAAFAEAEYPLVVTVVNHIPRRFNHRPLGLVLENSMGGVGTSKEVKINYFGELQTLCTEASVIGELNHYGDVIELQWEEATPFTAIDDIDLPPPAETAGGSEGGEVADAPIQTEQSVTETTGGSEGTVKPTNKPEKRGRNG